MNSIPDNLLRYISSLPSQRVNTAVILGGGLAGLSTGYSLAGAGRPVAVFESGADVGGLSRTVTHGDFRFDLGGHRFFTKNPKTDRFVRDLLDGDYLTVPRRSKIYLQNKFFDYPLKPANALSGLGLSTSLKAIADYGLEKVRAFFDPPRNVSLEDWIVSNFGRTMFNIYFREYSEKVWGIRCDQISEEWVSQRIRGLSLGVAIKNAFMKFSSHEAPTLIDEFIYPPMGIGQISEKLKAAIARENTVMTKTSVERIDHTGFNVKNIIARNCEHRYSVKGGEFISSIPVHSLLQMLNPPPPQEILDALKNLKYRDLVVVTVMLNRENVTDLTWMYLPEKKMQLGRIHEPRNWSPHMAPEGKTHIVAEYFCFRGDGIWNSSDDELEAMTAEQLEELKFIRRDEVIDSCVIRVPGAYPIFDVGYSEHYRKITDYLARFSNLHLIGRTGMFKYYNMDRAIESGLETAEAILKKEHPERELESLPVGA